MANSVDDLFRLHKSAFAAELSLAKAKKVDSEIRIKNKEELLHALTDKETYGKILEQGAEAHEVSEDIKGYLRDNRIYILDYFMRIIWIDMKYTTLTVTNLLIIQLI